MQLDNQEAERLVREGVDALRQKRPTDARARFEHVAESGRASAQIWLLLAVACRSQDDRNAEEAALDRLLALEPRFPRALIMKADCRSEAGDERGAFNFYKSAVLVTDGQQVPADLEQELQRAKAVMAQMQTGFEEHRERNLLARGLPPERRSSRFQQSLDILDGRRRIYVQEPTAYYFPELPQKQFYDPSDFSWTANVEAATEVIGKEIRALLDEGTDGFRPYIRTDANRPRLDDNRLLDNSDWSALFLCENGKIFEDVVVRCPETWRVMQSAPLCRMASSSPTVMFSLLRAGARIAPHQGMYNTRLVCHLPLIVPANCAFRVGNEVRQWEPGKLLIFDDSIEHEAWNESSEDRVVLIFDIWRPELTEQERQEVALLLQGEAG